MRTGLFTSPHLVSFRERMQVNRQLVSEAEVARLVNEVQALLKQFPADAHPTMFEVVTVMALKFFAVTTSYASGNAGGIFGPSLFIGAMLLMPRLKLDRPLRPVLPGAIPAGS